MSLLSYQLRHFFPKLNVGGDFILHPDKCVDKISGRCISKMDNLTRPFKWHNITALKLLVFQGLTFTHRDQMGEPL